VVANKKTTCTNFQTSHTEGLYALLRIQCWLPFKVTTCRLGFCPLSTFKAVLTGPPTQNRTFCTGRHRRQYQKSYVSEVMTQFCLGKYNYILVHYSRWPDKNVKIFCSSDFTNYIIFKIFLLTISPGHQICVVNP
jgi:hypothetical protein